MACQSVSSRVQRPGRVRAGRGGIYLRCRRSQRAQPDLHAKAWARGVGMFVVTDRKMRGLVREARAGRAVGPREVRAEGSGVMPRTVAMAQTPEDRARTKRWRVVPQIVLSRRGRLGSRFGQNHVKSTTWTPSTPRRKAWSRPTRRHRSAHASSRRWESARASGGR